MGVEELIIGKSNNGLGVFANRNLEINELVNVFEGNLLKHEELPHPYLLDRCVQIGKNLYLGLSIGIGDFINHSCNPNCGIKIENNKVWLIAIKKILTGEEIGWDYSTTMDEDNWEMICNCGEENCRKRIRDFKYLPEEIQKKYIKLDIVPDYIKEALN